MATQTEIFKLRLRISDPPGFIGFVEVDDADSLPTGPLSQHAYKQADTGEYKSTEKTDGASAADYSVEALSISDESISDAIDAYGFDGAVCNAIKQLIAKLGNEMRIKRISGGADDTEYQGLADTMSYYKDLLALCTEEKKSNNNTNSGRFFSTKTPEIAGGNL